MTDDAEVEFSSVDKGVTRGLSLIRRSVAVFGSGGSETKASDVRKERGEMAAPFEARRTPKGDGKGDGESDDDRRWRGSAINEGFIFEEEEEN